MLGDPTTWQTHAWPSLRAYDDLSARSRLAGGADHPTTQAENKNESKKYDLPQANKAFNDQLRAWSNEDPSHLLIDIVLVLKSLQKHDIPGEYLNPDYARDHTHLNIKGMIYTILGGSSRRQAIQSTKNLTIRRKKYPL